MTIEQRIRNAIEEAKTKYWEAYEYEFDYCEDYEMTEEQFTYVSMLRDEIRQLYYFLYGDWYQVSFEKNKINYTIKKQA